MGGGSFLSLASLLLLLPFILLLLSFLREAGFFSRFTSRHYYTTSSSPFPKHLSRSTRPRTSFPHRQPWLLVVLYLPPVICGYSSLILPPIGFYPGELRRRIIRSIAVLFMRNPSSDREFFTSSNQTLRGDSSHASYPISSSIIL